LIVYVAITVDNWPYVDKAFLLSVTYIITFWNFGTPYVETQCKIIIIAFLSAALIVILLSFGFLQPHVRVWNSVSLHTLAIIGIGEFERSICCLSFSKAVSTQTVDLCTSEKLLFCIVSW